jgi:drug/metabolite transporter (DMT)-like permease
MDTALGSICALGAALLFGTGVVIQASAAPGMPRADSLRLSLLLRMVTSIRWLWGAAIALLGWGLHAGALALAPLTLVQPVLALMLVVVLVLARVTLHEHVGPREIGGSAALIIGIGVIAVSAPSRSSHHASAWAIATMLIALAVIGLAPLLWRGFMNPRPGLVAICGGVAFALSGVATKLLTDSSPRSEAAHDVLLLILIGAAAIVAGISQMSALQRRPATHVIPIAFATEVMVPVALAPVVFNERLADLDAVSGGLLFAAMATVVLGIWLLASSPAVGDMIAASEA